MRNDNGAKRVFDLSYGDRFVLNGKTLEVISPYETKGIINGLLEPLMPDKFKDVVVYCVDVNKRTDIYPLKTNYLVYAY